MKQSRKFAVLNILENLFARLVFSLREKKRNEFNRVLPLGEYFFDRFEKAKFLKFGVGSSVHDSSYVYGDVQVGTGTWIGPFTILDGSGGLKIGSNCNISAGVQIYSHDTVSRVIHGSEIDKASVKIGNNVYIGPNSVISKGIIIGDNVVVGANSLVNKSIESNSKGWGTPFAVKGSAL